jgi:hypothetical protein
LDAGVTSALSVVVKKAFGVVVSIAVGTSTSLEKALAKLVAVQVHAAASARKSTSKTLDPIAVGVVAGSKVMVRLSFLITSFTQTLIDHSNAFFRSAIDKARLAFVQAVSRVTGTAVQSRFVQIEREARFVAVEPKSRLDGLAKILRIKPTKPQ